MKKLKSYKIERDLDVNKLIENKTAGTPWASLCSHLEKVEDALIQECIEHHDLRRSEKSVREVCFYMPAGSLGEVDRAKCGSNLEELFRVILTYEDEN